MSLTVAEVGYYRDVANIRDELASMRRQHETEIETLAELVSVLKLGLRAVAAMLPEEILQKTGLDFELTSAGII